MQTNLVMKLGVDWTRILTYTQANGTPVNLTGYTARMQVRASTGSSVKILDLTLGNGITIDGPNGVITIRVTAAQLTEGSSGLKLGSITSPVGPLYEVMDNGVNLSGLGRIAVYDLDIISSGGIITKLWTGQICFDPSVTR